VALAIAARFARKGWRAANVDEHPLWQLIAQRPQAIEQVRLFASGTGRATEVSFFFVNDTGECHEIALDEERARELTRALPELLPGASLAS
jgi:hypothetical protein